MRKKPSGNLEFRYNCLAYFTIKHRPSLQSMLPNETWASPHFFMLRLWSESPESWIRARPSRKPTNFHMQKFSFHAQQHLTWHSHQNTRKHIRGAQALLVLIHINKALIDRQDSPPAIDRFVKDLLWVFLELDLDNNPNPLHCCFWCLVHDPAPHDMKMQKKYRIYQPCKLSGRPS
jgi:hypothetical protein